MAAFQFAIPAAEEYFRSWVAMMQELPPSIASLRQIAPPDLLEVLIDLYQSGVEWSALIKSLSLQILVRAGNPITLTALSHLRNQFGSSPPAKFSASRFPESNRQRSARQLPIDRQLLIAPKPTTRVRGAQLKYATAPPITGPLPRTFMISGRAGLDHGPLRSFLNQLGFEEIELGSTPVHVGLFVLEQERRQYDPRSAGVTCALKSILASSKECITNKDQLYLKLKDLDPGRTAQYLAPTWPLRSLHTVAPDQILILKPVGPQGGGGAGIEIVSNTAELHQAQQNIFRKYPDGIASEYIREPLLFEGKKLHFRMYFLARSPVRCPRCQSHGGDCSVCSGRPSIPAYFELFDRGAILTAAEPYQDSDFWNPKIHDTHNKSTAANYYFPEDLARCHSFDGTPIEDVEAVSAELLEQMREILGVAAGVMLAQMKPWHYPESNFGYEIFGCDFMVRAIGSSRTVVLLEINNQIGTAPRTGGAKIIPPIEGPGIFEWDLQAYRSDPHYETLVSHVAFSRLFWEWTLNQAVLPVYAHFEPSVV